MVQKILRTLKHTEDATLQDATPNIYMLCDMALAMASALAKKQQPVKGKGSLSAAASHPGSVPLPSSFYKSLDLQTAGVMQNVMLEASQTLHQPYLHICIRIQCHLRLLRKVSTGWRWVHSVIKARKPFWWLYRLYLDDRQQTVSEHVCHACMCVAFLLQFSLSVPED